MTTLRPNYPAQEAGYFTYLASYGIPESVIANCCIKEADIAGIDSRSTVIVGYNEQEFSGIPVLVHTDIGTRVPLMRETEQGTVTDYFKDAALMFPLRGTSETKPIVYAAVDSRTDEVVAIVGIKRSAGVTYPGNFPTYKPFVQVTISVYDWLTSTTTASAKILYDVLVGAVAQIPTYTAGVPGLPFQNALGAPTDSVFTDMATFITDAVTDGGPLTVSSSVALGLRLPHETVLEETAALDEFYPYYSGAPEWTITDWDPIGASPEYQHILGATLLDTASYWGFSIPCAGSYSADGAYRDNYSATLNPSRTEVAGMKVFGYFDTFTPPMGDDDDLRAGSRIISLSDGSSVLRRVSSAYTGDGDTLVYDGSATVYMSFSDGEVLFDPQSFDVDYDHFGTATDPFVTSVDYHYSSYNISYLYGSHVSIFALTVNKGPIAGGDGFQNTGVLFQAFEAPNQNSLIKTKFIKDIFDACYAEIEDDYLDTVTSDNRLAMSIGMALYFVPCDTRVAKLMLDNSIPY